MRTIEAMRVVTTSARDVIKLLPAVLVLLAAAAAVLHVEKLKHVADALVDLWTLRAQLGEGIEVADEE
jgi:hypothetical protein